MKLQGKVQCPGAGDSVCVSVCVCVLGVGLKEQGRGDR